MGISQMPHRVITSWADASANFEFIRNLLSTHGAMTAQDNSTVDATYGNEERDVINNLRTRVGQLEARLNALQDN